jgi:hypothetical protein
MCRMHQEIHWTNVSYTEEKNCWAYQMMPQKT